MPCYISRVSINGCSPGKVVFVVQKGLEILFRRNCKKNVFDRFFSLGVSNTSDPVKPSSKRKHPHARTSRRSNTNNSNSNSYVPRKVYRAVQMWKRAIFRKKNVLLVRVPLRRMSKRVQKTRERLRDADFRIEDIYDSQLREKRFHRNAKIRDEIVDPRVRRREQDEV